jgi:hypothetical protein
MKNREFHNGKNNQMIVKYLCNGQFARYKKTVQLVPDVYKNKEGLMVSRRNTKGNQKMKPIVHYTEC